MDKYSVIAGQNLYDVALHLYGSIEGILDLLVNNPDVSLCDDLKAGQVLNYTEGYVVNQDLVDHNRINHIVPANGKRNVYFKTSFREPVADIYIPNQITSTYINISGMGTMDIDWGDNTPLLTVELTGEYKRLHHSFDNILPEDRRIRIYGDFYVQQLDLSALPVNELFLFQHFSVERLILKSQKMRIDSLSLLRNTYDLNLQGLRTESLVPLLACKKLMHLDLRGVKSAKLLDEYLAGLVKEHYGRRNCTVILSSQPSGEYKEPGRDGNQNYTILNGMEAIWLLVHEPAWNEGGNWKFIINDQVYTHEKN